jgi:glycosyltransferase involved in cell wall biosynthesis
MRISVVTVCYNSAHFIRNAIESVLAQTYPLVEYLLIDGGSEDGTVEIIREFAPRFGARMRWVSERDEGMYDAINKGIRMATGDVIGILNADDFFADDRVVERIADAFSIAKNTTNAKIDVVYGDVRFVKNCLSALVPDCLIEDGERAGISTNELTNYRTNELVSLRQATTLRYYSAKRWKPWMLQWGYMPPHPGVYIRRELFERLGYYKMGYHIAADYELLIRYLWKARLNCVYVPCSLVTMRMGGKSTKNWKSNLLLNQEIVRANRENGNFCCLPMLVPKYIFKIWEFVGNGKRMTM